MKRNLQILFCVLTGITFFLAKGAMAANVQADVTRPAFPVTINGLTLEQEHNQYPMLVYNNITYVPMTFNDARLLGLECNWTMEAGLQITKADFVAAQKAAQEQYVPYQNKNKNNNNYQAARPDFAITINGKKIDNNQEEYPLLVFRDVTYFPLTWRFAVDEFGWSYTFDQNDGLSITPIPTSNTTIYVSGEIVNLRDGAGTNFKQIAQVKQGAALVRLGEACDRDGKLWYQIQTEDGVKAWIASWLTSSLKPAPSNNDSNPSVTGEQTSKSTRYVSGDLVNLRSDADVDSTQMGQVKRGDVLTMVGQKNDADGELWYQIQTADGRKAWIASWLTTSTKPVSSEAMASSGVLTVLEMKPAQQEGKKTVIAIKNGVNNAYTIEKVNASSLQLLCDNVTLGSQTRWEGNGFTMIAEEAGYHKVRLTLYFALGNYAALTQEEDWLLLNCYKTGNSLAGRTIVLDPGHGGSDVGGQGKILGITDADVGYGVAVKLRTLLEQAGASVIMTREELPPNKKVFMKERMEMNNAVEPDIFVSIHGNATEEITKASGALVFTYNGNVYSQQYLSVNLAEKICNGLQSTTGKKAATRTDNFYVLRLNNHPSVLIETGFLSNPEEEALLATEAYRQKLAEGIYAGIAAYFQQF